MVKTCQRIGDCGVEFIDLIDDATFYFTTRSAVVSGLQNETLDCGHSHFAGGVLCKTQAEPVFRATRTLGVPARIAMQLLSPTSLRIYLSHTIRDIANHWNHSLPQGIDPCNVKPFDPRYTKMLPALHLLEVKLYAMWDLHYTPLFPLHKRSDLLPTDLNQIGEQYVKEVKRDVEANIAQQISNDEEVCIPFSGGADSGLVALAVANARKKQQHSGQLILSTLCVDQGGPDINAAETVSPLVKQLYPNTIWECIKINSSDIDHQKLMYDAFRTIEDYRIRDLECAMAGIVFLDALRKRHSKLTALFDGDGGNEFWQDYPLADEGYGRIALEDVHQDPHLFYLGYSIKKLSYSETYSGGLSRGYVRTFNTGRQFGFHGYSPLISGALVALASKIPLAQLAPTAERLHEIRAEAVKTGSRIVYGIDLPIFPKARFQEGCSANPDVFHISENESQQLKDDLTTLFR